MPRSLSHKRLIVIIIALAIATPIAYYLASPLWVSVRVSEELVPGTQSTTLAVGKFTDADSFHRTSGTATILRLEDGSRLLRLDEFQTINAPDLFVYLAADRQASDFVSLGNLKGNIGDQNYPIPVDANLARYRYVLIWCRAVSVLFGSAELA